MRSDIARQRFPQRLRIRDRRYGRQSLVLQLADPLDCLLAQILVWAVRRNAADGLELLLRANPNRNDAGLRASGNPHTAAFHGEVPYRVLLFLDGEPLDDIVVKTQSPSALFPGQDANP
jgi:hypothetical protein